KDYLSVLQADIKGIHSCYDYGYTKFNLEHSLPKDISHLLKEKQLQDGDILSKFNEVKLSLYELFKQYIPDYKVFQGYYENSNEYEIANGEYKIALDLLNREISNELRELNLFYEEAIEFFIYSIVNEDKDK